MVVFIFDYDCVDDFCFDSFALWFLLMTKDIKSVNFGFNQFYLCSNVLTSIFFFFFLSIEHKKEDQRFAVTCRVLPTHFVES